MSEWQKKLLGDVCSFQEGYVNPSQKESSYFGDDIKWLRANDLNESYVYDTSRKLSQKGFESAGKAAKLFKPDTIGISKSGSIGKLGLLKDYMCGNRAVINIEPKSTIDVRFLFSLLKANQAYFPDLSVGSVQPNLYVSSLASLEILLPPLPEQKAIASVLSSLDDKIDLLHRQNSTLEAMAETLFRQWFVEEADESWETLLGEIPIQILDGDRGKNYPKNHELEEIGHCLFLSAKNVTKNGFDFSQTQFISETKDTILNKGKLDRNDIVLTTRGTVGNIAYYDDKIEYNHIRINSGMVILRSDNLELDPLFVYCLLTSHYFKELISNHTSGSAQPQLPIRDLKQIRLFFPPKDCIDKFTTIVKPLFNKVFKNKKQTQVLTKQRDLLLPKLISGEVKVAL